MKLDNGIIQDIYHHALAMMGEKNGMDAVTLRQRLDSADRIRERLSELEGHEQYFFASISMPSSYEDEQTMVIDGNAIRSKITEWAALKGVDAFSGEPNEIKCVVCGKPAMTKATRCYLHAFGRTLAEDLRGS